MAFRATRKPTVKSKTKSAEAPKKAPVDVEPPAAAPVEISADALVAPPPVIAPPKEAPSPESFDISSIVGAPKAVPVPPVQKEERSTPQAPAQSYRPQGQHHERQSGGYHSQHRGGGRYYGGGDRNNDRNGGYRRNAMPRRDFAPSEGNGFTQDINVPTETVKGMLDIMPEGHGFLRPKFTPSERDVYISVSQIRRFLLRNGDVVQGQARAPKENERYYGLLKVESVNEKTADQMERRPRFEDLTPIYPNKLLRLETEQQPLSTRIIDLVAPIGFGQRGLVVSPPKAGKTTILKELAAGISANYPDVHLMAALIGERPEEVTDISRSVKGEVLASNFDESPQEQTRIAEVALERAKRLVEMGKDVVILLDSITRLARAYNLVVNPSGRTLSGGFDPAALYPAKRFLGAARCVEPAGQESNPDGTPAAVVLAGPTPQGTGGSLTVIGTALVDTGSRMDDLIYEEFKGTGNMELHLSRQLQERRVFPAIDIAKSGTRHDELLLGEETMKRVTTLRHMLSMLSDEERTLMLIDRLSKTKSNSEFLASLTQG